jgi:hypothetical protein
MEAAKVRQLKESDIGNGLRTSTPVSSVSWLGWRVIAAVLGGLILRFWMLFAFPQVSGDALIYGNLAKSLLLHGQFAMTDASGVVHPTLIRLPGYPLFLAACFRLFGVEHYNAVIFTQIALELLSCLLLADFVRRIWSDRAGLNTLWLAAMCPFTAVYASAPLTESLTFDMICLALWSLQRYQTQQSGLPSEVRRWGWLLLFTFAISYEALLRPDGPLVAVALWPALLYSRRPGAEFAPALRRALLVGILAVLPFIPWTIRNWQIFHVFEPLAPRYATDPSEDPHRGWQHWVGTWCLDFTSTYEVYWNIPDNALDVNTLPERALGTGEERAQTLALIADYNDNQEITPAIDARFEALAQQRTREHPLRTLVILPFGRLGDMLLRPRVENLTIDLRWWQYSQHGPETRFSWAYAALNLIFLILGIVGFCYRPRYWPYMAAYITLRCALLLTVEAPETRYTIEFFPILFVMGGIALQRVFRKRSVKKA